MRRLCLLLTFAAVPALAADPDPADKPILVLETGGHVGPVRGVFFLDGGKQLVSVGDDRTVRFWDTATGRGVRVMRLPAASDEDQARSISPHVYGALDAAGARLAVSAPGLGRTPGSWVWILDVRTGRVAGVLKQGRDTVADCLGWSPDGKTLAVGAPGRVELWDVASKAVTRTLPQPGRIVKAVAFSPDGKRLATGTAGKSVMNPAGGGDLRFWDLTADPASSKVVAESERGVTELAWSRDGKALAARVALGLVHEFAADGTRTRTTTGRFGGSGLAYSPAGKAELLVGACVINTSTAKKKAKNSTRTRLRDEPEPGAANDALEAGDPRMTASAWAANGMAALAGAEELVLWEATGRGVVTAPARRLGGKGFQVQTVGWTRDGGKVAWGPRRASPPERTFDFAALRLGAPGKADLADLAGPELKRGEVMLERDMLKVHLRGTDPPRHIQLGGRNPNHAMTFLGDGYVVVAGQPGCRVFDAGTGRKTPTGDLPGTGGSFAVAPRPDAKYFAVGGEGQTVGVYSPKSRSPVVSVFASGDEWVAWTPEGTTPRPRAASG